MLTIDKTGVAKLITLAVNQHYPNRAASRDTIARILPLSHPEVERLIDAEVASRKPKAPTVMEVLHDIARKHGAKHTLNHANDNDVQFDDDDVIEIEISAFELPSGPVTLADILRRMG